MDPAHDDLPETSTMPVRRGMPPDQAPPRTEGEVKDEAPPGDGTPEETTQSLRPGSLLLAALSQAGVGPPLPAPGTVTPDNAATPEDPPEAMTMVFRRGNGPLSDRVQAKPPSSKVERPPIPANPPLGGATREQRPDVQSEAFGHGRSSGFSLEAPLTTGPAEDVDAPADTHTLAFGRGGPPLGPAKERPASKPEFEDMPLPPKGLPPAGQKPSSKVSIPPPPPLAPVAPLPTPSHAEIGWAGLAPESVCPKCGGKLIGPESLGLCQACGYCRSLAEDSVLKTATVQESAEPRGSVESRTFSRILASLWLPLLGIGVAALVNVLGARYLPEDSPIRSYAAIGDLVLGIICFIVAQLWALVLVTPHDARIGARHFFLPLRLWMLSLLRLPETRVPVSLGPAGLALMAFAALWFGGVFYSPEIREPIGKKDVRKPQPLYVDKPVERTLRDAAVRLMKRDQLKHHTAVLTTGAKDILGGAEHLAKPMPKHDVLEDNRPATQCVIVGYVAGANTGRPVSLVLATMHDDKLTYAGLVRLGSDHVTELQQRLEDIADRKDWSIPGHTTKIKAIWVEPTVFCEIQSSGTDPAGHLIEPAFKALLRD